MSNVHLYEITEEARELQRMIEDGTFSDEEVADQMQAIALEFDDKAKAVAMMWKNLEAPEKALGEEIKKLQAKQKAVKNRREWLKDYLRENMAALDKTVIDCTVFKIRRKGASDIVVVDDVAQLPDEYVTVETVTKPDKGNLLAAAKEIRDRREAGEMVEDIPGCHLEKGQEPLEIK